MTACYCDFLLYLQPKFKTHCNDLVKDLVCFCNQLMLFHYGANINAADNDGNTPMHLATANGHEKVRLFF